MALKSAAIPRAAYDYQDLVGIETLIRFFRDPDLYEWVELESEDLVARSLDDVIAKRRDGSLEFTQVKFTVDADRYPLDWDWLLGTTGGGISLLAKWSAALARVSARGPVHRAALRTNRVSSVDFSACLRNGHVDLSLLDPALRVRIETNCGGSAAAIQFFSAFVFEEGRPDLPRLESDLRDLLVPLDTDSYGWLLLQQEVRRWATHRAQPAPAGQIRHEHLVQIITRRRPQPLRQDFRIPDGYEPPSTSFNGTIRSRLAGPAKLTILWGSPGRGKSTYLSHLVSALQKDEAVVLRHHYFLTDDDEITTRTSYMEIAASLIAQFGSRFPSQAASLSGEAHQLRADLTRVAEMLRDKPLYLIIDGLDHVWRDTQRTDQLDHLFNALLPLPANIHLIIGTQRVSDAHLPAKLVSMATSADWIEVPPMDEAAVHRWLRRQDELRPLILHSSRNRQEQLDEIAAALAKSSSGHPLHLIYALENMIRVGARIDADLVKQLPPCPDGDIRTYYAHLWSRIDAASRDMLHGLAGSGFSWPASGIRQCFGPQDAIDYLLEPRHGGMAPFHASLFAWIRERPDHGASIAALLPRIAAWLAADAPPYWKWGWHWLVEAKRGNTGPLTTGADRKWAVDSLAAGWPESHIYTILAAAERYSFDAADYPRALTQRAVKTRVANAPGFQARDFALFRAAALATSRNEQQILNCLDGLAALGENDLAALAYYTPRPYDVEMRRQCLAELRRRIEVWLELRHRPNDEFRTLVHRYIDIVVWEGADSVGRVVALLNRFREPARFYADYMERLREIGAIDALRALRLALKGQRWARLRRTCDEVMLRSAWRNQSNPDHLRIRRRRTSPLYAARAAWRDGARVAEIEPITPPIHLRGEKRDDTIWTPEDFFADVFWTAVYAESSGDMGVLSPIEQMDRSAGWIVEAVDCLLGTAREVVAGTLPPDLSALYLGAASIAKQGPSGSADQSMHDYMAFRKCLLSIGLDLGMLAGEAKRQPLVASDALSSVRDSVHWADVVLIERVAISGCQLLERSAAESFAESLSDRLANEVSEFSERGEHWTWLAAFALVHDLNCAPVIVRRAADCLLGYGYRRDSSVTDAIDAIGAVGMVTGQHSERWLRKLAPFVDAMDEFTDGDGSDFARSKFIRVMANTRPDFIPATYRFHLQQDDWNYADEVLRCALKEINLATPQAQALASTLLDHASLKAIERRGDSDPKAVEILDRQLKFLGGNPLPPREHTDSPSTPDDPDAVAAAKPSSFTPERFVDFVEAVSARGVGFETRRILTVEWLDHWVAKGKAAAALQAIEAHVVERESGSDLDELLDASFDVSLEHEGPDIAWNWIVRAHIYRHGWASNWSGDAVVLRRLEKAASNYRHRWREYIDATSAQPPFWAKQERSFALGHKYLVRFLILVGELDRAIAATDALIESLVAEIGDQPITDRSWLS